MGLLLLGQLLDELYIGGLEIWWRVVVLVEVDFAQEEHILTPDEEDAVGYVGVVALRGGGVGAGLQGEYPFGC